MKNNNENKHTSGEWSVQLLENGKNNYPNWNTYCVRSPQNNHIATVGHVDRYAEEDNEANAYLIAAAPSMYEALKSILEISDNLSIHPDFQKIYALCQKSIAKATGTPEPKAEGITSQGFDYVAH